MSIEDMEIENLDRIERLLAQNHGELSTSLTNNIDKIRQNLVSYEVGHILTERIADEMYQVTKLDDMKDIENNVKYLADTFWQQIGDR